MQRALITKAVLVAITFAVLLLPLAMVRGIVAERAARQQAVMQDVSASSFGRQIFAGPMLSLPYAEEYDEETGAGRERRTQRQRIERTLRLFPATSEVNGIAAVGEKHRGLFKVRTFRWQADVHGDFVFDAKTRMERTRANSHIVWGRPVISVGISDPRGLVGAPEFEWAGQRVDFERGSGVPGIPSGVHAFVAPIDPSQPQRLPYTLRIALQGTEGLGVVPVADDNRVSLKSDWAHPGFGGQFLPQPETQQIGNEGFAAQWTVTALASNAQQQVQALFQGGREDMRSLERLDVGFLEPIDIYAMSDRALKYGFLFIGLTFGCFLLFEVLKHLPVHPAQYALVGLGLATFFLLLVALSEHIAFWKAYLIAATACIALLGYYLGAALRGAGRSVSFATMLTALYSALYGLLVSEDNALLLGALLVFAVIAAAMVLTRNVDWYRDARVESAGC